MAFLSKLFNLPVAATVTILGGAIALAARAMPKCMHGTQHYSFPQSVRSKTDASRFERITIRTCNICGEVRFYDWDNMVFLTKKQTKEYLEGCNAGPTFGTAAVV
jgi:hypothetical protein